MDMNSYSEDITGSFDTNDINQNKGVSVVAYIPILFLIPLFGASNSPFAKFHANQGIILTIFAVAAGIFEAIVNLVLGWIPIIGTIISVLVSLVLGLSVLGLMIYGIICTAQGNAKKLPFIGNLIEIVK
jgi:uncharacterized membrane protein